jgi:hypothetical protein
MRRSTIPRLYGSQSMQSPAHITVPALLFLDLGRLEQMERPRRSRAHRRPHGRDASVWRPSTINILALRQNNAIKASVNNQTKTVIQTSVAEAANTITSNGPTENISKVLDFTGCGSTLSFGIVVPLSQSSPIWAQLHVPRTALRLAETGPATDCMKSPRDVVCDDCSHRERLHEPTYHESGLLSIQTFRTIDQTRQHWMLLNSRAPSDWQKSESTLFCEGFPSAY